MLASPNPSAQAVQLPPSAELGPADPIWRHVKTEWDQQFIKRVNFLPWLRAQLQIDPIDEAGPAPEPLLCYVKRRLALAQNQQRLRETANRGQSSPLAPTVQPVNAARGKAPSNGASNTSGSFGEPTQASSIASQDCRGNSSRPGPFESPQSDGVPVTYGHSASDASRLGSNQLLNQTLAPPSSTSFSNKSPPSTSNAFSSQLGAIADAHMGNSFHMTPASLSSAASSQTIDFQYNSNGIGIPQPYLQVDAPGHPFPQSQVLFTRQDVTECNQQHASHMSQLAIPLTSSAYVDHPAQSSLALAFATTHAHPLQPQNVNQYSHASQPVKVTQYAPFSDTHKVTVEHQENAFAPSNQSFEFDGSAPISESGNCTSGPLVPIDPTLMAGYETTYGMASNQSLPLISPGMDVAPQVTTAQPVDALSPRRTRSGAALTKKTKPAPTTGRKSSTEKAPSTKRDTPRAASLTIAYTSVEVIPNLPAHKSPSNERANLMEHQNASNNPSPSPPPDQYNRKAWTSRLASVRTELDHIYKAPARSASKLVKIFSMYSVSPTPHSGDWSTVPPEGRIEVLSAMKAAVPQDFYSTWVSESKGLAILETWLKGSVHAQEKAKPKENSDGNADDDEAVQRQTLLINLLQTLAKLPLTVENLKNHTFAKQVMRINKDQNASKFSDAVKRLSVALEQKWRAVVRGVPAPMLRNGSSDSLTNPAVSTSGTKKRPETAPDSNHSKKRKVETARTSITTMPSTSKSAIELFGRPGKAKLPAFTKKALEATATPPVVVQDTFAEAMGLLGGNNTTGTSAQLVPSTSTRYSNAGGKSAKRIRFVADNELCQIKIVERLVYEGEEYETHPVGDARKMDAVEGRYLHQSDSFLEEEVEWEAPSEVVLTSETIANLATSPLVSSELAAQEERERVSAGVTYEDESQIPDTPHEPGDLERSTVGAVMPRLMKLGGNILLDPEVSHLIAKAQADNSVDAPVAPDHTVLDLLARLGGGSGALPEHSDYASRATLPLPAGFDASLPPGMDLDLMNSISQSGSLQALLAASGNINIVRATLFGSVNDGSQHAIDLTERPPIVPIVKPTQPAPTNHVTDPFSAMVRDNGWGAAAGSGSRGQPIDAPAPYIPTGPRNKRRKKGKDGSQPRISAHDSFGRHIPCKWWPNCPHGTKCFYKHG